MVVATRSALIPRRDEHADAFGRTLLFDAVEECVAGFAQLQLAGTVTHAEDGRGLLRDDVLQRQFETGGGRGVPRDHQDHVGTGGGRADHFHVQGVLALIAVRAVLTRILAVVNHRRDFRRQAEALSEGRHVTERDIAAGDDGHRHARADDGRAFPP